MTFQHLFVVQLLISFSVIVFLDVFPLFVEQGAFLHSWHRHWTFQRDWKILLLARFLLSHEEKSYYETYTCLDRIRDFLIVAIDGGNKHCRVVPVQFRRKPSASRFPELGVRDWDHQWAAMSTIQCNRSSTTGR